VIGFGSTGKLNEIYFCGIPLLARIIMYINSSDDVCAVRSGDFSPYCCAAIIISSCYR
jgi:hypothetical protein